jgi:photosystem II stability/assembly factor-like uncharacterized protein
MKWETVPSGTNETLTSIAVDQERRVWIGGANGALLSSDDDGRSFRSHATSVEHGFQRLFCSGTTRLVALSGGSIVAADLGSEPVTFQATTCRSRHLFGFCGITNTVYATGRRGALVRSIDGGSRWKSLKTECSSFLYSIAASASGRVICAGGDGVVTRSIDAGVTWRTIPLGYRRYVRGIAVLDDGDITVVADSGRISQIDASGSCRAIESGTEADLYAVCANGAGEIIAVGDGVVLCGRDAEWTAEPIPDVYLLDVRTTPSGRAIAVGYRGAILTRA